MNATRVAVALSGGVDSATAAALLIEQGYDVLGVTMKLWREPRGQETAEDESAKGQEPQPDPTEGARRVAEALHIPLYVIDAVDLFKHCVVDRFIAEYSAGRTPNPCLYCNRHVKFGLLLAQAVALGADKLATGHYARIRLVADDQMRQVCRWQLLKGLDPHKDQSYVLYALGQEELSRVLFPLGELTKHQVRQMAAARHLPAADTPESQDLCFVSDAAGSPAAGSPAARSPAARSPHDYRRFLRRYVPAAKTLSQAFAPGPILDSSGREIGQHKGLAWYTIGQRGGMGIAAPEALYVLRLDMQRNAIIAGPRRELGRDHLIAQDVHWISGQPPTAPLSVQAKIRYKADPAQAIVTPLSDARAEVRFAQPLRDITPGQGVVWYNDEAVVGGGLIVE